jgi:hypothetical protein
MSCSSAKPRSSKCKLWPAHGFASRSNGNLNITPKVKAIKDRYQPVDGEAVWLGFADARKVGGGNAGHVFGFITGYAMTQ